MEANTTASLRNVFLNSRVLIRSRWFGFARRLGPQAFCRDRHLAWRPAAFRIDGGQRCGLIGPRRLVGEAVEYSASHFLEEAGEGQQRKGRVPGEFRRRVGCATKLFVNPRRRGLLQGGTEHLLFKQMQAHRAPACAGGPKRPDFRFSVARRGFEAGTDKYGSAIISGAGVIHGCFAYRLGRRPNQRTCLLEPALATGGPRGKWPQFQWCWHPVAQDLLNGALRTHNYCAVLPGRSARRDKCCRFGGLAGQPDAQITPQAGASYDREEPGRPNLSEGETQAHPTPNRAVPT